MPAREYSLVGRSLFALSLSLPLLVLAGCSGLTETRAPGLTPGVALQGNIHGGQNPVSGSSVYLFAAGVSGYDSAATSLLKSGASGVTLDTNGNGYVTSGTGGSFTISSDYDCPSDNREVYIVAYGGNPGLSSPTADNGDLALMAALGTCANLKATPFIQINEVTTVAAAWALAPFAAATKTNTLIDTKGSSVTIPSFSTSATNLIGFANAFKTVNVLTNTPTGSANTTLTWPDPPFPTVPATLTVPQTEINTLANILASCVNTNGTDGTCDTIFAYATPAGGTAPTNTIQAAIDIALNPGHNVGSLYNQIAPQAPFVPYLATNQVPTQWTLSIAYSGTTFNPQQLAVDGEGNVWTVSRSSGLLIELTTTGTSPIYEALAAGDGFVQPASLAVDGAGNVWVANEGGGSGSVEHSNIIEVNSAGVPSSTSPYTANDTITDAVGIAIDAGGNVWVSNQDPANSDGTVVELSSNGTPFIKSPYITGGLYNVSGIAIDTSGDAWILNDGSNSVTELNGGLAVAGDPFTGSGTLNTPANIAFDGSGKMWIPNNLGNTVSVLNANGSLSTTYSGDGFNFPYGVAIDGSGSAWISNVGAGNVTRIKSDGTTGSGSPYATGDSTVEPAGIAVDGSGNVWVANLEGSSIIEFVGAGVPVVTPIAVGVQNHTLGSKP